MSRTDNTSLAIGIASLTERMRSLSSQLKELLDLHQRREEALAKRAEEQARFESKISVELETLSTTHKAVQAEQEVLGKRIEKMDDRLKALEYRRDSDDRKEADQRATGPRDALKAMETTQRVEESKTRSKLWVALAAAVAAVGGALTTWFASKN